MKLTQSIFFLVAAALALAVGAGYAADEHIGKDKNDPGFKALDKNNDGYLSRTEAAGNPQLFKKFKQADKNGDNKLSRIEYLEAMTKQDATTAKNKAERAIDKDDKKPASAGSTSSK